MYGLYSREVVGFSAPSLLKWRRAWWEDTTIKNKEAWWSRRGVNSCVDKGLEPRSWPDDQVLLMLWYLMLLFPRPAIWSQHGLPCESYPSCLLKFHTRGKLFFAWVSNLEFSSTQRASAFVLCPWWPPGWSPITGSTLWGKLEHGREKYNYWCKQERWLKKR